MILLGHDLSPVEEAVSWAQDYWMTLVLTGEIVGAVLAVKVGAYRRGLAWLGAALLTVWLGAYRCRFSDSTAGRA